MAPTVYGDISTSCLGTPDTDSGASTPTCSSLSSPSQKMVPPTSHPGHQQVLSLLCSHFPDSLTTITPSHQDHYNSLLPIGLPAPATPTTFSMQQPAKALLPLPQLHCCLLKTKSSVFVHRAFAHTVALPTCLPTVGPGQLLPYSSGLGLNAISSESLPIIIYSNNNMTANIYCLLFIIVLRALKYPTSFSK